MCHEEPSGKETPKNALLYEKVYVYTRSRRVHKILKSDY